MPIDSETLEILYIIVPLWVIMMALGFGMWYRIIKIISASKDHDPQLYEKWGQPSFGKFLLGGIDAMNFLGIVFSIPFTNPKKITNDGVYQSKLQSIRLMMLGWNIMCVLVLATAVNLVFPYITKL